MSAPSASAASLDPVTLANLHAASFVAPYVGSAPRLVASTNEGSVWAGLGADTFVTVLAAVDGVPLRRSTRVDGPVCAELVRESAPPPPAHADADVGCAAPLPATVPNDTELNVAAAGGVSEAVKEVVRNVATSTGAPRAAQTWRGMVNTSNVCYVHAVLQALLGTPRFYDLLTRLEPMYYDVVQEETPVLYAFVSLIRDVRAADPVAELTDALRLGDAFEPTYFYALIEAFVASALGDDGGAEIGRQHDAHEWWTFLRSSLEGELRRAGGPTLISDLLGGTIESKLTGLSGLPSITHQPFSELMLELGGAKTITDALVAAMEPEYVTDYGSDPIRKTPSFASLPPVLVLQCQRFAFNRASQMSTKVTKRIPLAEELTIPGNLCTDADQPRAYVLRSVIEHRGESSGNGHYVAHVRSSATSWLLLDDHDVTAHTKPQVDLGGVYVLVYEQPRQHTT